MIGWSILQHVVLALTMTKIADISTKVESDAFLSLTYVKQVINNTIVKEKI